MILCPETQENGTVMIHDLSHLGLSHARQYNLGLIKKHVAVLQVRIAEKNECKNFWLNLNRF